MRLKGISDKGFSRIAQRVSKTAGTEPRVYVGTYGKYNSGSIDGAWLDLSDYSSLEEFYEAARELHKDEEDPEFMFQDHEGIPDGMVSESHLDPEFFEYQRVTSDWDEDTRDAFETFMEYMWSGNEGDMSEILEAFESSYRGEYRSLEDYAYELVDDVGGPRELLGDRVESYFDEDKFRRDLEADGWYVEDGIIYEPGGEEYGEGTLSELIDSWLEDTGVIDMANYFNYEAFGRDLELGGDISFIKGCIFENNY